MAGLQLEPRAESLIPEQKDIRARPDSPIDPSIQSDEEKQRASLVKQRPLALIRQVKESNGMEAHRLLVQSFL